MAYLFHDLIPLRHLGLRECGARALEERMDSVKATQTVKVSDKSLEDASENV